MAKKRRRLQALTKHKYKARPTRVDGRRFASLKEANRFRQLRLLQQAGKISDLRCQVPFPLIIPTKYIADFVYIDNRDGCEVVEDVKGYRTPEYKRKKKLMAEQHGVSIRET